MADFLVFPLGIPGIASELSVRLIGAGFVVPGALAVVEDAEVPALYYAEMAGAAGSYGAVLLRDGATLATIPTFAWSGAEFEMSLTAAETQAAVAAAIEAYPVAKPDDVQVSVLPTPVTVNPTPITVEPTPVTVNPTPVTVSGGFLPGDRAAAEATRDRLEKLAKRQGLEAGVSATVKDAAPGQPGQLVTSDGAIAQTMTVNDDGSVTIENAAD